MAEAQPDRASAGERVQRLIAGWIAAGPRRLAGSSTERAAQERMADAFRDAGAEPNWQRFRHTDHLYKVLALHFGVGLLGTVLLPLSA